MARQAAIARLLVAAVVLLIAGSVRAGRTDPDLALTSVHSIAAGGAVLVRFEGALLADDLIQLAYPLQLLIWEQSTNPTYVRVDLSAAAVSGSAPELADGLTPAEALNLLSQGTPLGAAAVTFVGPGRIDVRLPSGVLSGAAGAAAFVLYEDEAIVSNTVQLVIPQATP